MKILLVSNMYPSPSNPGYGVFVRNFESAMRAHGVCFDLAVINGKGVGRLDKLIRYVGFFLNVAYKVVFRKYDCVYVHYIAHSMIPLVPLLFFKKIKLVCNAHGEDLLPVSFLERLIFRVVRHTVEGAEMVVVPSGYFASIANDKLGNVNVFVSPSGGIDLDIFKPIPGAAIRGDVFRIGFVSRIDVGKGWDILLNAALEIKSKTPELKFKIDFVGEGGQVSELCRMIEDLNLEDVVSYLGPMEQKDLPRFYASLNVFVFPTVRNAESLGLVGLEALACGVPVICTKIGGVTSYMKHGVNGFLFSPGNYHELADLVYLYVGLSPCEVTEMKKAASLTVVEYDKSHVALRLYNKLEQIISV
jgi:glycosyltransferase involved in cell wall biosynthesis